MPLPDFNAAGDLPPGVHRSTLTEVINRFGSGSDQRRICTQLLVHIVEIAKRTGCLLRFILFGSYVTSKSDPNDVDVVLVMSDSFRLADCPLESRGLFDHSLAEARYGASVFWIRPGMLIGEGIEDFVAYWQVKRGGDRRGIVEVIP